MDPSLAAATMLGSSEAVFVKSDLVDQETVLLSWGSVLTNVKSFTSAYAEIGTASSYGRIQL